MLPDWRFTVPLLLVCLGLIPGVTWAFYRSARRYVEADPALIRRVYLMRFVGVEAIIFPSASTAVWPTFGFVQTPWSGALLVATILSALVGGLLFSGSAWLQWRAQRDGRWRDEPEPTPGEPSREA